MSDPSPSASSDDLPGSSAHLIERAVDRMARLAAPQPPKAANHGTGAATTTIATIAGASAKAAEPASPQPSPPTVAPKEPSISVPTLVSAGVAVAGARRSRIAEEWRVTAAQLLRTLRAIRPDAALAINNLLLVTSANAGEGKSFCALNLAASLALGGLSEVLLVDTDSKPDSLSHLLGIAERPGLFDLAAGPHLRPDDLVLTSAVAGLDVVPVGRPARGDDASDRGITRSVVTAIEQVARRFPNRVVVIDSAPCLATSDAAALAPAMAQIALIVEAERTQRDSVEAALELLRPCPNVTLILNKVRLATSRAFGGYNYSSG